MKMNEQDRNLMLDALLTEGESYQAKIWAVLMADTATVAGLVGFSHFVTGNSGFAGALGAFTNQYCYVGLTEQSINIAVIETMDVSQVKAQFKIPRTAIQNVKVKGSFIPGRKTVHLSLEGKKKFSISVMSSAIGTDIKDQKENATKFIEAINQ